MLRLPILMVHCKRTCNTVKMNSTTYQMPHSQMNSPPILVLHGLNLSGSNWRRSARHMMKQGSRWLIVVDARNHGESPHCESHTPADMAADVAALIEERMLKRIVALGHGMGGRALMTLALTRPDLVERIIVVDITPGPLPPEVINAARLFKLMVDVLPKIPKDLSLQEGRTFIMPELRKLIKNETDLTLIVANLQKDDNGCFAWSVNAKAIFDGWSQLMIRYKQSLKGLPPYQGETLLIAGRKTKFVTPTNVKIMKKFFPKLHVEYLNAHHKVHVDQPQKFVQLVVDFTKTCTGCKML
ncbi:PREDICTED: protein ABHD11 [Drosophila arizonae]|uniref:sn-1-specific diacylglycerol lipase ABHD11 n=1 Tax=Drosophila arizonae TaxID=7263 RepID=A0ABM1Q5C8_DROAR|nr:PREDICTED: protein ABHD11 [Drosophila arizonae]